jgi:hypothetical protein
VGHDGPHSAAQLEQGRTLAPVPSTGDDNRVRDDPARRQRIEERMIGMCRVEHGGDVDVLPGARLSHRKQLHDALEPTNVARRYDMEDAHPALRMTPL